jgi:hypothetical protein
VDAIWLQAEQQWFGDTPVQRADGSGKRSDHSY